jgi:hypothetical protein
MIARWVFWLALLAAFPVPMGLELNDGYTTAFPTAASATLSITACRC